MALLLVPYTDDEDATWLEYAKRVVNYSFDFKGTEFNYACLRLANRDTNSFPKVAVRLATSLHFTHTFTTLPQPLPSSPLSSSSMQLTSYPLRPAAGIVIDLTFDIFKMPDFGIPSLDASYLLSMGIFIVTVFLAYLRQAFSICLGLPIFNFAKSSPGRVERLIMRVFSLSRCVRTRNPHPGVFIKMFNNTGV